MDADQILVPLRLQLLSQLLNHKFSGFMFVFSIFCIQKLIEFLEGLFACQVIFRHEFGNRLEEPIVELSYFHVVVELDEADIAYALEGQGAEAGIGGEEGVGSGDVEGDILPNFHVDFLDVEMF